MPAVTGIFARLEEARAALRALSSFGIPVDRINLLTPGAQGAELAKVPTTDAEQPGVGKAFGGLLGGALGAAGGMQLGATAASLFLPGVGPILALGTAAAVLVGAGGAMGGAALGEQFDESMTKGLPTDELYLYKDALRKGRTVVVVQLEDGTEGDKVRQILVSAGAESLDAAKESWWIGIRDAEAAQYEGTEGNFKAVETSYRLGFESAQQPEAHGKSFEEALPWLRRRYTAHVCGEPAFRSGYERGKEHLEASQSIPLTAL